MTKGYSPTRRWLRAERAREHQESVGPDERWVRAWRTSEVPPLTRMAAPFAEEALRLGRGHEVALPEDKPVYVTRMRWD